MHITTHNKEYLAHRCRRSTNVQLCLIFLYIPIWVESYWMACRILHNRRDVNITTHAIKRHFLIWMTTVRQPTKHRCSCVLTLKYTFICVYWWTRQRIHNTLIAVDRYLRLMGDKNDSRLGEASSGIISSPIRCRYRCTTSRCSGFL